jgi:hypothetical protein
MTLRLVFWSSSLGMFRRQVGVQIYKEFEWKCNPENGSSVLIEHFVNYQIGAQYGDMLQKSH